jgi:hypothetical protein
MNMKQQAMIKLPMLYFSFFREVMQEVPSDGGYLTNSWGFLMM